VISDALAAAILDDCALPLARSHMHEVRIKADEGRAWLRLVRQGAARRSNQSDHVVVTLVDGGLEARAEVYVPPERGLEGLVGLFAAMADQWRGWSGEKQWGSLEGELSLTCSHDGLGHVRIAVELQPDMRDESWAVRAVLVVWAGSLEQTARTLGAYVASLPG
jgi:hypothetical protein